MSQSESYKHALQWFMFLDNNQLVTIFMKKFSSPSNWVWINYQQSIISPSLNETKRVEKSNCMRFFPMRGALENPRRIWRYKRAGEGGRSTFFYSCEVSNVHLPRGPHLCSQLYRSEPYLRKAGVLRINDSSHVGESVASQNCFEITWK